MIQQLVNIFVYLIYFIISNANQLMMNRLKANIEVKAKTQKNVIPVFAPT